ncbi:MAG: HIT family protein [Acidimicrobiia bacterium]
MPDGSGEPAIQGSRLDYIWAGWRSEYVTEGPKHECVLCALAQGAEEERVLARNEFAFAVMNAYPYTSGHLMVAPLRHVSGLEELSAPEYAAQNALVRDAVVAVKAAFRPDGVNVGYNLGAAAGAGVPGHVHGHVLPRWVADANFMTSIANVRVMPESLDTSFNKLRTSWPH